MGKGNLTVDSCQHRRSSWVARRTCAGLPAHSERHRHGPGPLAASDRASRHRLVGPLHRRSGRLKNGQAHSSVDPWTGPRRPNIRPRCSDNAGIAETCRPYAGARGARRAASGISLIHRERRSPDARTDPIGYGRPPRRPGPAAHHAQRRNHGPTRRLRAASMGPAPRRTRLSPIRHPPRRTQRLLSPRPSR